MGNYNLNLINVKSTKNSPSSNKSYFKQEKLNRDGNSYKDELFSMMRDDSSSRNNQSSSSNQRQLISTSPSLLSQLSTNSGNASVLKGDANNDGKVDESDVELVTKFMKKKTSSINIDAADMDGNGKITASDLSGLSKLVSQSKISDTSSIRNNRLGNGSEDDWSNYEKHDTVTALKGDINNDGEVDISDTIAMKMHLVGLSKITDNEMLQRANIDGDGKIGVHDLTLLVDYQIGEIGDKEWGSKFKEIEVVSERRYTKTLDTNKKFSSENGIVELKKGDVVTVVEKRQPDGSMSESVVRINFQGVDRSGAKLNFSNGGETELAVHGVKMANISGGTAYVVGTDHTYHDNFSIYDAEHSNMDIYGNNVHILRSRGGNTINVKGNNAFIYNAIDDTIVADGKFTEIHFARGNNSAIINGDNSKVDCLTGKNNITVNADNVTVSGGQGDDRIVINGRNASIHTGNGNDTIVIGSNCSNAVVSGYNSYTIKHDTLEFSNDLGTLQAYYSDSAGGVVIATADNQKLITLKGLKNNSIGKIQELVNKHNSAQPTLKEEFNETKRIFHVMPGYHQGDQYIEEGGLFVTNLSVGKNLNEEKSITFDLYNTKDAMGIIEYYE